MTTTATEQITRRSRTLSPSRPTARSTLRTSSWFRRESLTRPQAYVTRAIVEGFPVTALCGYTWVPSKDPRDKPVCSGCLDIYQQPGEHRDEREELPDA
jgi:hypothetical protein